MLAVEVGAFGGPEVLTPGEAPDPVPGPGAVVVAVAAADVIFLDTQIRGGWGAQFGITPPYVPGGAVAGVVLAAGDGVDAGWVGRLVTARTARSGGYAERALAPVESLVPVPDGLAPREAAALQHDGPTALALHDNADLKPGEWVLITAAAGGMGVLLVQLARAAGARVVAAVRGERKRDLVAGLGADVVVDYAEPGWAERVRAATGGAGVQVVLDGVGGALGQQAFAVTADGGRFSAHGAAAGGFAQIDPDAARRRGVRLRGIEQVQFDRAEARRLTERALAEAAAGRMTPVVGQTFPLALAADAHAAIEGRRAVGKTLLVV